MTSARIAYEKSLRAWLREVKKPAGKQKPGYAMAHALAFTALMHENTKGERS